MARVAYAPYWIPFIVPQGIKQGYIPLLISSISVSVFALMAKTFLGIKSYNTQRSSPLSLTNQAFRFLSS